MHTLGKCPLLLVDDALTIVSSSAKSGGVVKISGVSLELVSGSLNMGHTPPLLEPHCLCLFKSLAFMPDDNTAPPSELRKTSN